MCNVSTIFSYIVLDVIIQGFKQMQMYSPEVKEIGVKLFIDIFEAEGILCWIWLIWTLHSRAFASCSRVHFPVWPSPRNP